MFHIHFLYTAPMKCPNCGVACPAGAAECPACGVIFEKFKKKLDALPPPTPPRFPLWLGRVIAVAIVVLWMLGLTVYFKTLGQMPQPRRGTGTIQVPPPDAH